MMTGSNGDTIYLDNGLKVGTKKERNGITLDARIVENSMHRRHIEAISP